MTIGLNAKLYRNTASYGTPTWALIGNVQDLTANDSMDEADVSTRGSGGFAEAEPTLRTLELSFGMINKPGDADVAAFLAAYTARSSIDIAVMDGPIATAGSKGVRARYKIFQFPRAQELRGAQTFDVMLKPCADSNPPADMTIS